jgi:hypothetical protein
VIVHIIEKAQGLKSIGIKRRVDIKEWKCNGMTT